MLNLADKRVLVTGGAGFVGEHLLRLLRGRGCRQVLAPSRKEYDLAREEDARGMFRETRPQIVIHLAGVVGGIEASRLHPGHTFYGNLMMGAFCMEYARRSAVEKFVGVGTICSYPKVTPVPFREEDLWNGYPEEAHAPYGLAKKMLLIQSQAYRQQYGFNAIHLLPVNLYGPGDHFDSENPPVVSALIRRCVEAHERRQPLTCWGDGTPTREFLYVEDCAEAILLAAERYDGADPVNVGSGQETSIRQLVQHITEAVGFRGEVTWDRTKPAGQPRRCLDIRRARSAFGFQARTPLPEGLRATVQWYRTHRRTDG